MALSLRITPDSVMIKRPYMVLGIEIMPVACKVSASSIVPGLANYFVANREALLSVNVGEIHTTLFL